jgi:hypothetical protein
MKLVTAEEAVKVINSRERIFIQSVSAAPQTLIQALTARAPELARRRDLSSSYGRRGAIQRA